MTLAWLVTSSCWIRGQSMPLGSTVYLDPKVDHDAKDIASLVAYGRIVPATGENLQALKKESVKKLTLKEVCVLAKLPASNKQIAGQMRISVETVKEHLQNISAKLGIYGRGE